MSTHLAHLDQIAQLERELAEARKDAQDSHRDSLREKERRRSIHERYRDVTAAAFPSPTEYIAECERREVVQLTAAEYALWVVERLEQARALFGALA